MKIDKSVDSLSGRLHKLEEEREIASSSDEPDVPYATAEELKQMSPEERYEARFNWYVKEIMPYYKAEVMRLHSITSDEEYGRRVLEGDTSIYLPQPNRKFEPTSYKNRVAHLLGLNYQELQVKFNREELEHKIAGCDSSGRCDNRWRDEDPNAVF